MIRGLNLFITLPLVNSGAYNPEKVISFWLKICTYAHMENEHEIWVLSILSTPPSPGADHILFLLILFQYGGVCKLCPRISLVKFQKKSCRFGFENDFCCMPFGNLRPKVIDRLHQLHHREPLRLGY